MLKTILILLIAAPLAFLLRQKITTDAMRIHIALLAALDRLGTASALSIAIEINQHQKSLNEKTFSRSTVYAALGYLYGEGLITEVPNSTRNHGFRPTLYRLSDQGRRVKEAYEKQPQDETPGPLPV